MKKRTLAGALAPMLAMAALMGGASAASADDPRDPAMQDPGNRARDRAIIRQLNRNQLAYVQKRDAEYAKGWKAWREYKQGRGAGAGGDEAYAAARARHAREMAAWRRAVSLCEAGRTEYCDRR